MQIKSALSAVGGVVSVVLAGGGLMLAAQPASASESPFPPATVQAYDVNMDSNVKPWTTQASSKVFDTLTETADGSALDGWVSDWGYTYSLGVSSVYPSTSVQGAGGNSVSIRLDAPRLAAVQGLWSAYQVNASKVQGTCTTDASGNANASVTVDGPVPGGVPKNPAPNHTVTLPGQYGGSVKVVYNEQTELPNGQLSVVAMHIYVDLPAKSKLKGKTAEWSYGDAAFGLMTCGGIEQEPVKITTPKDGTTLDLVDAQPTITGTGEPGASVDVTIDSSTLRAQINVGTTTVDAAGNWKIDTAKALESGTHTIKAVQTAKYNYVTRDTSTVIVADSDEVPAIDFGALLAAVLER